MEHNKKETVHRVGTITCGTILIVMGTLFLLRMIFPLLSYLFIFRLWPCVFILLGIEILIANGKKDACFIYDTGAVVLLILLVLFAMGMALIDYLIETPYATGFYFY